MTATLTDTLFESLYKKGLIRKAYLLNIVKEKYSNYALVKAYKDSQNKIKISVKNTDTHQEKVITPEEIDSICGMDIERFLGAYDIRSDNKPTTIDVKIVTDVEKTVLGKKNASLIDVELYNDLTIILREDKTEKWNYKRIRVCGVGESIYFKLHKGRPMKRYG